MKNPKFPKILRRLWPAGWRTYKRDKRRELREAIAVFESFNYGSAFVPKEAYTHYCIARNELDKVQQLISEKEWGR